MKRRIRSAVRLLALAVLLLPRSARPEEPDAAVAAAVEKLAPSIIELRHRIHEHPELGNREVETAKLVAKKLKDLGLEVQTGVARTGVIGILKGGKPGPVVAARADMDALPVTEQTTLEYKSTVRTTYLGEEVGVAHACGHDVHTAALLGVAAVLASMKSDVPGTVKFLFQPAEEGPPPGEDGGAKLMVEESALQNPRPGAIFALHSWPELPVGQVAVNPGPTLAAVDHFNAKVIGQQSHGAYPHLGVDPIVMAAQVILGLQTIRSRNLSPTEPSVVTVGIVRGGERFNIIPGEVLLEGTVRTYSTEAQQIVQRRMREILDGITRAGGGTFELDYQHVDPVTTNDPALFARMRPTLERVLGAANVLDAQPTMGGEDFAYFANQVPGFYYRLGVVAPGTTSGGLHTPTFLADDTAVPVAMRTMTLLLLDWLRTGSEAPTPAPSPAPTSAPSPTP
jgi:amidohydrolase